MPPTSNPSLRLGVAIAVSGAVVLSAPFLGQLRAYLRAAFPGQFVIIVGAAVAVGVVGALTLAIAPILVLYLLFSRYLVRGLTAGAVK